MLPVCFLMSEVPLHPLARRLTYYPSRRLTDRGKRNSQFHEFTGKVTSKVNSHYLSRSQWLQLPNPTAHRRF